MDEEIAQQVVDAWNKTHVGYCIQVEWGIGKLKQKWQRMMKRFDNKHLQFCHFFEAPTKLTNFFHWCCTIFDRVVRHEQEEMKTSVAGVEISKYHKILRINSFGFFRSFIHMN